MFYEKLKVEGFKMRGPQFGLMVVLGFLLIACSPSTSLNSPSSQIVSNPKGGQRLPVTAKAMINGEVIDLEVATTPQEQEIGLMYRTALEKNQGMLFPFSESRLVRFWMKNMSISLDMIFLQDETVKAVLADVPPCTVDPCPVYGPPTLVNRVLELPAGRAKELGLKEGDRLQIEFLKTP